MNVAVPPQSIDSPSLEGELQPFVVDTQTMQDRCIQIVDVTDFPPHCN